MWERLAIRVLGYVPATVRAQSETAGRRCTPQRHHEIQTGTSSCRLAQTPEPAGQLRGPPARGVEFEPIGLLTPSYGQIIVHSQVIEPRGVGMGERRSSNLARECFGVGVVGVAMIGLLSACGGALPDSPDRDLLVSSPVFSSTRSMLVESDLVVMGTVSNVAPGREVGEGPEKIQYRDVTITVKEVLFSRGEKPTTAVVQETGWVNGKSAQNVDLPWSAVGDVGYFFLQKDVPGKYGYLGPQARVLIQDSKLSPGGDHDLKAVQRVAAEGVQEYATEIAENARAVSEAKTPNPPGPAMGDGDAQ